MRQLEVDHAGLAVDSDSLTLRPAGKPGTEPSARMLLCLEQPAFAVKEELTRTLLTSRLTMPLRIGIDFSTFSRVCTTPTRMTHAVKSCCLNMARQYEQQRGYSCAHQHLEHLLLCL